MSLKTSKKKLTIETLDTPWPTVGVLENGEVLGTIDNAVFWDTAAENYDPVKDDGLGTIYKANIKNTDWAFRTGKIVTKVLDSSSNAVDGVGEAYFNDTKKSWAFGNGSVADGEKQFAAGTYNLVSSVTGPNDPKIIFGNGSDSNNRSNVYSISDSGIHNFAPTSGGLTTDPVGAPEGSLYYNKTLHKFRGFDGTTWTNLN